jgi:hypothetical protein
MENLRTQNRTERFTAEQMQVLNKIESINRLLILNDINCKTYSPEALKKLASMNDIEALRRVEKSYAHLEEILGDVIPQTKEDHHNTEIHYLKKALNKFGMRVEDDFWANLRKGDAIEVYGTDMIQKYRSLNFYNFTSYSLLDLVIHEWYVLWERPLSIMNAMMEMADDIIKGRRGSGKMNLKRHLIREIFDSGITEPFVPRALAVDLKYAAPVYKSVGKQVAGFIVTCKCHVVSTGDDALNIDFI